MDMLKTFFEYGCDSTLFDGLKIMGEQELCRKYMGRFPVISITLKDIQARSNTDRKFFSDIQASSLPHHFHLKLSHNLIV
mgnify:CR=1 FL=1